MKALVPFGFDYARAIEGLVTPTSDIDDFYENTNEYSLVLFTGGPDISPHLYGETSPKGYCFVDDARDSAEISIFKHAVKNNVKMAGICRGLQLLTVMCCGRLLHHLDGHSRMTTHSFKCSNTNNNIQVNSLHHQMCIPPKDGYIVGWCGTRESDRYIGDGDKEVVWTGPEVEALAMPYKQCVGVQYHPEMMSKTTAGYKWFYFFIHDFLFTSRKSFMSIYVKGNKYNVLTKSSSTQS